MEMNPRKMEAKVACKNMIGQITSNDQVKLLK